VKKSLFATILIAILALSLVLAGCASNFSRPRRSPPRGHHRDGPRQEGKRVGTAPGYFPFEMTDSRAKSSGLTSTSRRRLPTP
jgi:hypothetical protein